MITQIKTLEELKQIIAEIALAKTDRITKVSPGSVVDGFFTGMAKVAQKAFKDIAIVESHLFPEFAYGENLDAIAERLGIGGRLGASSSSTYVRLAGEVGTQYFSATHRIIGSQGLLFELESDTTIPAQGYIYAKVRSVEEGEKTNCEPLALNKVVPQPVGHLMVVNEYQCSGGRDSESDELFKLRIRDYINSISLKTLAYYTQVLMRLNPNVLRVYKRSIDQYGRNVLVVVSHNGTDFSSDELQEMEEGLAEYLSFNDLKDFGGRISGITLENPTWKAIDVEFRVDLSPSADLQRVRIDIQSRFSKYVDYRFWKYGDIVQWTDLLEIVKGSQWVNYVPDIYFSPSSNIDIKVNELPRFRGFIMRGMSGEILYNAGEVLNPLYYPREKSLLIR